MNSSILPNLTASQAQVETDNGAILIDVRETGETARQYIEGAELWPLSQMPNGKPNINRKKTIIYLCASGARTNRNAKKLAGAMPNKSYMMQGGLMAWKRAKYPIKQIDTGDTNPLIKIVLIGGFITLVAMYLI